MGAPMAMNLRKGMPKESTMWVNDVDKAAADRFIQEHSSKGPIKFVKTAKEVAENAVSPFLVLMSGYNIYDRSVWVSRSRCLQQSRNGNIAGQRPG
jgi:(2Fe-2S) ferredoxin